MLCCWLISGSCLWPLVMPVRSVALMSLYPNVHVQSSSGFHSDTNNCRLVSSSLGSGRPLGDPLKCGPSTLQPFFCSCPPLPCSEHELPKGGTAPCSHCCCLPLSPAYALGTRYCSLIVCCKCGKQISPNHKGTSKTLCSLKKIERTYHACKWSVVKMVPRFLEMT